MTLQISKDPEAEATLTEENMYEIEWIPEKNYVAGTEFELRLLRLRPFVHWKFIRWYVEKADITYRWKVDYTITDMRKNPDRVLMRAKLQYGVNKGEPVNIKLWAIPHIWAGINAGLDVWIYDYKRQFGTWEKSEEAQREAGSRCELKVKAAPAGRLEVISRPGAAPGGKVRTCLVPKDRFGNPTQFKQEIPVKIKWEQQEWTEKIKDLVVIEHKSPADIGRMQVSLPIENLQPEETIFNGEQRGSEYLLTGNPVWVDTLGGRRPAFGEFHWHTEFSGDGGRTIQQALKAARDTMNMDFAAPGDHNTSGEDWKETVKVLNSFNKEDNFATFFGWEASSTMGHENHYFTGPDHPLVCDGSAGYTGGPPEEFPEELKEIPGYISIPHHTNAVAETRDPETDIPLWHPYPWREPEARIKLVEIMQIRGNHERNQYSDNWRGWHQNHGASVQDALERGHQIGFTGGTDNHCGYPGRAFAACEGTAAIHLQPPHSYILTGLWTPELKRQQVFDSLAAKHTWAVSNTRALVHYSVNDVLCGGNLEVDEGTELTAHLKLSAEDSLATVEIVSEKDVVWQQSFVEKDIELDIPLVKANEDTHFYLRARERSGGIIYASPVFVEIK